MAASGNLLIEVNINDPSRSSIYMNFNILAAVYGIVSFSPNCQDVRSYAITQFSKVYEIDFLNRQLLPPCSLTKAKVGTVQIMALR